MRSKKWQFDATIAARFSKEARTHIPNYESVIQKSIEVAKAAFPNKRARIIDVGSATGYTLKRLSAAGFSDIHGVESSIAMIERSVHKNRVVHSRKFPKELGPFDVVLANWTLHFIRDRRTYIRDIHTSLSRGGIFVLSDKMRSNPLVHGLYHDFKRSVGVSDREIDRKEASIRGVLVPYSLERYCEILSDVGFKDISVIDGHWSFASLIAFK